MLYPKAACLNAQPESFRPHEPLTSDGTRSDGPLFGSGLLLLEWCRP
jgi:hypothetical protein